MSGTTSRRADSIGRAARRRNGRRRAAAVRSSRAATFTAESAISAAARPTDSIRPSFRSCRDETRRRRAMRRRDRNPCERDEACDGEDLGARAGGAQHRRATVPAAAASEARRAAIELVEEHGAIALALKAENESRGRSTATVRRRHPDLPPPADRDRCRGVSKFASNVRAVVAAIPSRAPGPRLPRRRRPASPRSWRCRRRWRWS